MVASLGNIGAAVGLLDTAAVTIASRFDLNAVQITGIALTVEATTRHFASDGLISFFAVHNVPPPKSFRPAAGRSGGGTSRSVMIEAVRGRRLQRRPVFMSTATSDGTVILFRAA